MGFITSLMDPLLNPLLVFRPLWVIVGISLIVSLVITLVYKWATDQEEMKRLKDKINEYQEKMKESRDDTDKVKELQKKSMSTNLEYMKHSFKPTLITFIPIILIFGWLQAHMAYDPVMVGDTFSVDVELDDNVKGVSLDTPEGLRVVGENSTSSGVIFNVEAESEGEYFVDVVVDGESFSKEVLITDEQDYASKSKSFDEGAVNRISLGYDKLTPLGDFSVFGYKPGWLALYIVLSVVLSMGLRKVFGLY